MTSVFCTDCAAECELVDGSRITPGFAGSPFWHCPICPDSWSRDIRGIGPGEPPSGPETKRARTILQKDRIEPLIVEAVAWQPGTRTIAQGRIVAFVGIRLGLPLEGFGLGVLSIEQLRDAYRLLATMTYREIYACATQKQPRTAR